MRGHTNLVISMTICLRSFRAKQQQLPKGWNYLSPFQHMSFNSAFHPSEVSKSSTSLPRWD